MRARRDFAGMMKKAERSPTSRLPIYPTTTIINGVAVTYGWDDGNNRHEGGRPLKGVHTPFTQQPPIPFTRKKTSDDND